MLFVLFVFAAPLFEIGAHPGSGIVVDSQGNVFFTDTGQGIWKIAPSGRVSSQEGPAFHWMAIDPRSRLGTARLPKLEEPSATITRIGTNPTLVLSSDFPLTTAPDGALIYPEFGSDERLRVYRVTPSEGRTVLATLPAGADGKELRWLNGMAAGPDGSIYFSENAAVRRIDSGGTVSTIARDIMVPGCARIPEASERLGPMLRGLDITADGSIYVAASACSTLLKISPQGEVRSVFRSEAPWSPTGVVASQDVIYVLEYLHTDSGDRRDWIPRVRKFASDGSNSLIAAIERSGPESSRVISLPAPPAPK
jgi:streptogramin lyase